MSEKVFHKETYTECQQVCMNGSCMLYVPFNRRYGRERAECLKWGKGAKPQSGRAVVPPMPKGLEDAPEGE